MDSHETPTPAKVSSTQKTLMVGIALIVLVIVAVGVLILSKLNAATANSTDALAKPGTGNLVVDDTFDPNAMREKAADNMFEVKMNAQWVFPNGTSASTDAYVANSLANSKPFYFEVALQDTKEIVYTSPVIELGAAVREFALTKDLPAGNYKADCMYHLLNADQTVANTVTVAVTIMVAA